MKKKIFKRGMAGLLAVLTAFTTLIGMGTTAFAASETAESYKVIAYDDYVMSQEQKIIVQRMADAMGVNYSPLITRLKELDLFDKRPIEEYLSTFRSGGELA